MKIEIDSQTLKDLVLQAKVAPPRDGWAADAIYDAERALNEQTSQRECVGQLSLFDARQYEV